MKYEYNLDGLDCASCAAKIEYAVQSVIGVESAAVSFATSTLVAESSKENVDQEILSAIKKIEPDIVVTEKKHAKRNTDDDRHDHSLAAEGKKTLFRLLVGAAIFALAYIIDSTKILPSFIAIGIFVVSYLILGGDVLLRAFKNILRGQIFDENFLMTVATIGAFAIGEYPEGAAVMLFYQIGEYFQGLAVRKSKKSIANLMDIRPDFANLKKDGQIVQVSPDTVQIGDVFLVKPGEKIPLDGIVIEGTSMLDTSALTGESVPRKAKVEDEVLSGCINQTGVLTIQATKLYGQSTVARIIDLVENASSKKAPTENFITTFSRYYTPVVMLLAALIAIIPPLFLGGGWADWINRGLIFLVISCPCALVISIPLGFFGGIGAASRRGILVKGSNYLEALNKLDIIVFDKTGTLTKGVFAVTSILPANDFSEQQVLAFAAQAESFSIHPIATSIMKAFGGSIDRESVQDYTEIAGHGISVVFQGKAILAGNQRLMEQENIAFTPSQEFGTEVYIAVDGIFAGCITIADEIKPDSAEAIALLRERGVSKSIMLTGDTVETAKAIAEKIGVDEFYGGLLPHQKVEKLELIEQQKRKKGKLAFVGDGINDAPVLARADIGIAMGGLGSDAAIEAADVVVMTDEPSKIAEAVDVARMTKRIVMQNIVFALGVKGLFLLLGALGVATMWEAVFADVGVSILAILNASRIMRTKK